jgi:hypothetical protein
VNDQLTRSVGAPPVIVDDRLAAAYGDATGALSVRQANGPKRDYRSTGEILIKNNELNWWF